MIKITFKFGAVNSTTREYASPVSFGDIYTESIRAALEAGDNVTPYINGVAIADGTLIASDCTIRLETKAASKA